VSLYAGSDAGYAGRYQSVSDEILKVFQEIPFYQIPAPVSFFDEANDYDLPLATLQQQLGPIPVEGFCEICFKHNAASRVLGTTCLECVRRREACSRALLRHSQNAVADGRAAKDNGKYRGSSENLLAWMRGYNGTFITSWAVISLMPAYS
jgi:hypothetical protein